MEAAVSIEFIGGIVIGLGLGLGLRDLADRTLSGISWIHANGRDGYGSESGRRTIGQPDREQEGPAPNGRAPE